MATHFIPYREQIDGRDFAEVEYADRVRQRYIRRCMIDGKPVSRAKWETERKAALEKQGFSFPQD